MINLISIGAMIEEIIAIKIMIEKISLVINPIVKPIVATIIWIVPLVLVPTANKTEVQ